MENKLPALHELHYDIDKAFENDQLNLLLNQPPSDKWVKKHPLAKTKNEQGQLVPASYLPIGRIELLLTQIFQEWRVEILREGVMFHSVYVTVRIHYKHPLTGEWSFHDGGGAKSVQVDAGKNASDLSAIKDAAVQMAFPSAISYAIKDAAEHLGKLFGRDLNREEIQFKTQYDRVATTDTIDPPHREEPFTDVNDDLPL